VNVPIHEAPFGGERKRKKKNLTATGEIKTEKKRPLTTAERRSGVPPVENIAWKRGEKRCGKEKIPTHGKLEAEVPRQKQKELNPGKEAKSDQ